MLVNIILYNESSRRVVKYIKGIELDRVSKRSDIVVNPDITNINLKYALVNFDNTLMNMSALQIQEERVQLFKDHYAELRAGLYDQIGDQLDILLKQLDYSSSVGEITLIPAMQLLINKWKQIKQQYPKG